MKLFRFICSDFGLFLISFVLLALAGIGIETMLVPHFFPQLDDGAGLMINSDADTYHHFAMQVLDDMRTRGLAGWQLSPHGAAISGLIALLYYVTVPSPLVWVVVSAAFCGLAVMTLLRIGMLCGVARQWMWPAALSLICFPSAMLWFTQLGKDGIYVLGLYLIIASWIELILTPSHAAVRPWVSWVSGAAGMACLLLARPYMLMILAAGFAVVGICWTLLQCFRSPDRRHLLRQLLTIAVWIVALFIASHAFKGNFNSWDSVQKYMTESAPLPPSKIDRWLPGMQKYTTSLVRYRLRFLDLYPHANNNIDPQSIRSADDLLPYLPRAIAVACCQPLPFGDNGMLPGASQTIFSRLMQLETLIICSGLLCTAWAGARGKVPTAVLVTVLALTAFVLLPAVYIGPNLGTLHRARYGLLIMLASIGWGHVIQACLGSRRTIESA